MISDPIYAHTNEIRYLGGHVEVKELPESEWPKCMKIYPKSEKTQSSRMRGYEALEDHPKGLFKKGDFVRILPTSCISGKSLKAKKTLSHKKGIPYNLMVK